MFKEKHLIFKQGPQKPQGPSEKPKVEQLKEESEIVEERHELSADIAEGLISEGAAGAVESTGDVEVGEIDDITEDYLRVLIENKSRIFRVSTGKIFKALADNKFPDLIRRKIEDGYEYTGFSEGGLIWNWYKDGETFSEISPIFYKKGVHSLMSSGGRNLLSQYRTKLEQKEIREKVGKEFSDIIDELKGRGIIDRGLTLSKIKKSDFGNDLLAMLETSYYSEKEGKGRGYEINYTSKGIILRASEFFKKGRYDDVKIKLSDYDSELNYKAIAKKLFQEPEQRYEIPEKEDIDIEWEKSEENRRMQKRADELREEMPEHQEFEDKIKRLKDPEPMDEEELSDFIGDMENLMDSVSSKSPELSTINKDVKSFMMDLQELFDTEIQRGIDEDEIYKLISELGENSNLIGRFKAIRNEAKEAAKTGDYEKLALTREYNDMIKATGAAIGYRYGMELE